MADKSGVLAFFPAPDGAPDPDRFLSEVLDGWANMMRAKGLKAAYIATTRAVVMQLGDFSGRFLREWLPRDADDWFTHLRAVKGLAHSTVRKYQGAIESFCEYATSPHYDWSEHSARVFGSVFSHVVTEFGRITHSQPNEARPAKRAFTLRELQQFFDLADLEYERVLESGRSGALAVLRDAAAFKAAYGWGLRVNELRHLQLVDFSPNYRAPYFGDYGTLHVRWGKAKAGQIFKARNGLTVFDWAAEVVDDWIHNGRRLATHPAKKKPELLATAPTQVWSWDITKLRGPAKGIWYHLYALIDIFSRFSPSHIVCAAEDSIVAADFIDDAIGRNGSAPHTVHADRGTSMTSKPVSALLTDLGITRSHSRPHVSNDNPFSEAQFKTLKYVPDFPDHFDSLAEAKAFCDGFFTEYNHVHHHSGIGWHTPASVHFDTYQDIDEARQQTLNRIYRQRPERFNRPPRPPQIRHEAWINEPAKEEETATVEMTKTV